MEIKNISCVCHIVVVLMWVWNYRAKFSHLPCHLRSFMRSYLLILRGWLCRHISFLPKAWGTWGRWGVGEVLGDTDLGWPHVLRCSSGGFELPEKQSNRHCLYFMQRSIMEYLYKIYTLNSASQHVSQIPGAIRIYLEII